MKLLIKRSMPIAVAAVTVLFVGCSTPTRFSRSTGEFIDDKTMAAKVKDAMKDDSLVRSADIRVSVFRGNVHLTGFVDHPIQKERAGEIVSEVQGVEWFKNDVLVKKELPGSRAFATEIEDPAGSTRAESEMKVEKIDPNALREQRLNPDRSPQSNRSTSNPGAGWQRAERIERSERLERTEP